MLDPVPPRWSHHDEIGVGVLDRREDLDASPSSPQDGSDAKAGIVVQLGDCVVQKITPGGLERRDHVHARECLGGGTINRYVDDVDERDRCTERARELDRTNQRMLGRRPGLERHEDVSNGGHPYSRSMRGTNRRPQSWRASVGMTMRETAKLPER